MKLNLFEWDVLKHHKDIPLTQLTTNEVAFIANNDHNQRYVIGIDKETGQLKVYKTGFIDDALTVTMIGANQFLIK